MEDDGGAESGRTRLARGTKPHARTDPRERAASGPSAAAPLPVAGPVGGTPSHAGRAPAQSIREAVEQLLEAQEADEAIAEWMQGGG